MSKFFVIILLFFTSCLDLRTKKHITNSYYLMNSELPKEGIGLYFKLKNQDYIGVVGCRLVAISYNDSFIFLKQEQKNNFNENYYIISLFDKINLSPDENKIGPLDLLEFKNKVIDFGILKEVVWEKVEL